MEEALKEKLLQETQLAAKAEDWDAVVSIWKRWADEGDAEAQFQIAYQYLFGPFGEEDTETHDEMVSLLRSAAAQDHADAMYWLYIETHSGEQDAKADALLLKAGMSGSIWAQRDLGALYATGWWTGPKDPVEGARWYRRAAERGHAEAQYNLGFMILEGEGTEKNVDEGLYWLHLSAEQGEGQAIRLLADAYANGYFGVPLDGKKAAFWNAKLDSNPRQ